MLNMLEVTKSTRVTNADKDQLANHGLHCLLFSAYFEIFHKSIECFCIDGKMDLIKICHTGPVK
jgi:plasmid rolling circle replication initiator protein Rep